MKFERQAIVQLKDIGRKNQLTNYAILSFLEEIGSTHSALCGYGINDIQTKHRAWILMDWKLKVLKRPNYGEILDIKTWARPIKEMQFFTYRDYEIYCKGELVAIATSKWILIDTNSKKITKLTKDILTSYNPEEKSVFEETDILKIKEPDEKELKMTYTVRRWDIDMIEHMHNLNYLNLAYEILPEETYNSGEKQNVRIMYKHQIVLGDKVNCYYTKKNDKDIITLKSEDDKILHSIIELS